MNNDPLGFGGFQTFNQPQQQTPKPNKHNLLVDSLPTIGGIVGGIGGGALGGLLGGGVGAVPGAAALGAGGSALGQTLENILTGDNIGKDVAKEAVLGGIFSAGPLKLLKFGAAVPAALTGGGELAGGLTKGLVENGAKIAAEDAAGQVAGQAADNAGKQVLKTSLAGRLTDAGNKALASQYGTIGKNVARATDPLGTIGKLADMGILKPTDAERISRAITGSDGILTQQVANAIGKAGNVAVDAIPSITQDAITQNMLHGLPEADALTKLVDANLATIQKAGGTPDSVMGAIRNLESQASQKIGTYGNYHMATATDKQVANALRDVTDGLKNQLYEAAGANKNVANVLTPELRDQLLKLHPDNQQWQNFVDNTVMKAKNIGDLRSAQSPFVNIQKIIHEADLNNMTFGGRVANHFGGPGGLPGKALDMAAGVVKNPASRIVGSNLRDIGTGEALQQAPKGLNGLAANLGIVNMLASGLAPSQGSGGLEGAVTGDQAVGPNSQPQSANPSMTNTTTMANPNIPGQYQQTSQMSNSPYTQEGLVADIQRDPKNAEKYIAYYNELDKIFNPQGGANAPFSKPSAQVYSQGIAGLQSIQQLQNLLGQHPDVVNKSASIPGQDLPFGIGSHISGALGTSQYRAISNNILNSIARINTGANMPQDERVFYEQTYLPQPGDSADTVKQKIANLYSFFNPIVSYNGSDSSAGSSDLTSALTGGAY